MQQLVSDAVVAELVDALGSGSSVSNDVGVRVSPTAPDLPFLSAAEEDSGIPQRTFLQRAR